MPLVGIGVVADACRRSDVLSGGGAAGSARRQNDSRNGRGGKREDGEREGGSHDVWIEGLVVLGRMKDVNMT